MDEQMISGEAEPVVRETGEQLLAGTIKTLQACGAKVAMVAMVLTMPSP
jgi:cation transport ATPase